MPQLILAAVSSFVITVIAVFPSIKLAKKFRLMDDPTLRPHPAHVQKRVVPRAGGLSIFLGICLASLLFAQLDKYLLGIFFSLILLLSVGLIDDLLTNFSPYLRLILQFMAAAIVVSFGVGVTFINNPFGGILRLDTIILPLNFFGPHSIVLIADIFAYLWIVWMMNMVNWSKGTDGQMPGTIAVAAITLGLFSYKLFLQGDPNQFNIASLSFITAGAALGFLIFNWHPAKIFPGFSGSTILGFMVAVLSILSGAKLAIALLILIVPATDFFYTFTRRILSGKSPFFGDQKHLYHLLLQVGWSHQKIALFYILGSIFLGVVALNLNSSGKLFATLVAVTIIVAGILWLNFFGEFLKRRVPGNG